MGLRDYLASTRRRVELIRRIRELDGYYQGKSDHRVIEDGLKMLAWNLRTGQRSPEEIANDQAP